ncbi:MAG: cbb3-type cytochrome oxidase assembly protein CcoS [Flavobacteriaceae bacterium]
MSVIYVLLAISITVALVFFAAFVLSVKRGQYDDAYTPSVRMLFEDEILSDLNKGGTENKEIKQNKDQTNTYGNTTI